MRNIVADLKDMNIEITSDHVLGLLLQINLKDGKVKQELARNVEHIMYQNHSHSVPTFDNLRKLLEVCHFQIQFLSHSDIPPPQASLL